MSFRLPIAAVSLCGNVARATSMPTLSTVSCGARALPLGARAVKAPNMMMTRHPRSFIQTILPTTRPLTTTTSMKSAFVKPMWKREGSRQGKGEEYNNNKANPRSLTAAIISALAGTSAVTLGAVWLAPASAAPKASSPSIAPVVVDEPHVSETIPPPPPGWLRRHLQPELLTLGGVLGACTGYFTKKIGKIVAFSVGAGFVFLQLLVHAGLITIKWSNVQKSFNRRLQADETGRVPPGKITRMTKRMLGWLTADVPFAGGFIAGFWIGFRYG